MKPAIITLPGASWCNSLWQAIFSVWPTYLRFLSNYVYVSWWFPTYSTSLKGLVSHGCFNFNCFRSRLRGSWPQSSKRRRRSERRLRKSGVWKRWATMPERGHWEWWWEECWRSRKKMSWRRYGHLLRFDKLQVTVMLGYFSTRGLYMYTVFMSRAHLLSD